MLAALALLPLPLAQAIPSSDVLVVDALGAGDFTSIQAAVDAAQGGEVILVRGQSGAFQGFEIAGKRLTVTNDSGGAVQIAGTVRVTDLPAGAETVLCGLHVTGVLSAGQTEALLVDACAGSVRIERSTFLGANNLSQPRDCQGYADNQGFDAAWVQNSANVAFVSCVFIGGQGVWMEGDPWEKGCEFWTQGGDGGRGLVASHSTLALYECAVVGGDAGQGGWGGNGGNGLVLETMLAATEVLSGTSAMGGAGGAGFDWFYGPGGNGGAGLIASTPTYVIDGAFLGGAGGQGGFGFSSGIPGQDVLGPTIAWQGASRDLRVNSPVKEGSTLKLTFQGEPSDYALLFVSVSQSFLLFPQYKGAALIGTAKALPAGVCGATGKLELLVPIPPLEAGFEAVVLAAQAVFVTTAGEIFAGPPGHAVLLDAAF